MSLCSFVDLSSCLRYQGMCLDTATILTVLSQYCMKAWFAVTMPLFSLCLALFVSQRKEGRRWNGGTHEGEG